MQRPGGFRDGHAVALEKSQRGAGTDAFVAVEERLRFGEVKGIGGGNIEEVALAIKLDVTRMHDRAFKSRRIPDTVLSPVLLQREPVECLDLRQRKKRRLGVHWLSLRIKSV